MDVGRPTGGQQFRDKNNPDPRMYNPQRDIAWITPQLMQLTTNSFFKEGEAQTEFVSEVGRVYGGGDGDDIDYEPHFCKLTELCMAIGHDFCTQFLRGNRTFTEAFKDTGLYERFPAWMVSLWLKHFGYTVMSAFYYGVRDVMIKGQPDPMNFDAIFKTAEEVRKAINDAT